MPEETAARLAEASRLYRQRKTLNNFVYSLIVTGIAVFVLVLFVPRDDTPVDRNIDFHDVAAQAEAAQGGRSLADPQLPTEWRANAAEWRAGGSDKVLSWYIGLLTPADQFISLTQAFDANPTWLSDRLQNQAATGTVTVEGVTWDVYRNAKPEADRGNFDYALVTVAGESTYLLVGTADTDEFDVLAAAMAPEVEKESSE
jgi:hypothetical protein